MARRKNNTTQNIIAVLILLFFCILIGTVVVFTLKRIGNIQAPVTSDVGTSGDTQNLQTVSPETKNTKDTKDTKDTKVTKDTGTDTKTPPVTEADPYEGKKIVAFTFDDGPDTYGKLTDQIVNKMKEVNGRCTFFVLGSRIASVNTPALKRAVEAGCEIGNHSTSHAQFKNLSLDEQRKEIIDTNEKVKEAVGVYPKLFRPPYGNFQRDTAAEVLAGLNMKVVLWSVDPEDWKYRDAETVRDNILKDAKNGSIILLHNIYDTTADGFCMAVDELKKQGYEFVTVSELLGNVTSDVSVFHYARNYSR